MVEDGKFSGYLIEKAAERTLESCMFELEPSEIDSVYRSGPR